MLKIEHAPRLVLGMWSTSPTGEATVSFAKASRRSKSDPDSPFDIKDLTTALSQIEGHAKNDLYFEYKVPADPNLVTLPANRSERDSLAHGYLITAIDRLLEWRWDDAKAESKQVLLYAESEDLRDEALNVIAASMAMSGDIEAGVAALKQAVEGQWNYALQQNLGILALRSDPVLAANQSTFWLDAASSSDDRERAIFFVLSMWADLEENDEVSLPERIRDSFRNALTQELSMSTFMTLGLFLARNDSAWTASPGNWVTSPNFSSDAANLIMARAEGFDQYVDYLVEHSASIDPEILGARDNLVSQMIDVMFDDPESIWAASVALKMFESGLPCDSLNNALIRALAVQTICNYFRQNDGEPKESILILLEEAETFRSTLSGEALQEFMQTVLDNAATMFVLGYVIARENEIDAMSGPLGTVYGMSQSWGSRRRLNKHEARKLAQTILEWAKEVELMTNRFDQFSLSQEEVRGFVTNLKQTQERARSMALQILGKL